MKITIIKGKKRKTFSTVRAAKAFAGKAKKVAVIVTQ